MRVLGFFAVVAVILCFAIAAVAQPTLGTIRVVFTTIDVPGAGYTILWGINSAGDIVGSYGQQDNGQDAHGFLYEGGTFTYFDYPGQTLTIPTGINDSGLILGYSGQSPIMGFLYDGISFTTLTDGDYTATVPFGINNAGYIVGGVGTIYDTAGFEMRSGRYKKLQVPGTYVYIYGSAINNFGTMVGWGISGIYTDGFVCRGLNNCKTMDYPGAVQTEIRGINDSGLMAGWFSVSGGYSAFVVKNGKFFPFAFPGAAGTFAEGINNAGQIVGAYTSDYQTWHGFVTNPITDADFR